MKKVLFHAEQHFFYMPEALLSLAQTGILCYHKRAKKALQTNICKACAES